MPVSISARPELLVLVGAVFCVYILYTNGTDATAANFLLMPYSAYKVTPTDENRPPFKKDFFTPDESHCELAKK
jgi:hypothetical protein